MIAVRVYDFEKVAINLGATLNRIFRGVARDERGPKIVRNRIESYLQTKSGVTGANTGSKRRKRVSAQLRKGGHPD